MPLGPRREGCDWLSQVEHLRFTIGAALESTPPSFGVTVNYENQAHYVADPMPADFFLNWSREPNVECAFIQGTTTLMSAYGTYLTKLVD